MGDESLAEHDASLCLQNVAVGEPCDPPTPRQNWNRKAKSGYEDAQQHERKGREVKPASSVQLGQRGDQHSEQYRLGPAAHMGSLMRLWISVIPPASTPLKEHHQNLTKIGAIRDW